MGAGDFALNAHVRQIFARHWLETQGMNLITANGILSITGRLVFRTVKQGKGTEITPDFMGLLESELRGIRGIKRVRWQLDNWVKKEDGWAPSSEGEASKAPGLKPPQTPPAAAPAK
jgi:hypothetical protein